MFDINGDGDVEADEFAQVCSIPIYIQLGQAYFYSLPDINQRDPASGLILQYIPIKEHKWYIEEQAKLAPICKCTNATVVIILVISLYVRLCGICFKRP